MSIDWLWEGVFAGLCLWAAGLDIYLRKIPNSLCLVVALAGAVYAWDTAGLVGLGWHSLHAVIALLVGMGLFAARLIGGGDAKFYAAVAMWFELSMGIRLLLSVSIAAVVAILVWMLARRLARKPWRKGGDDPYDSFPYGVAIALGAVLALI